MFEFQLTENVPFKAERILLEEKKERTIKTVHPAFIFITGHQLSIRFSFLEDKTIDPGQLILLPRDIVCHIQSIQQQTVLLLHVPNMEALYLHFFQAVPKKGNHDMDNLFQPLPLEGPVNRLIRDLELYLNEYRGEHLLFGLKTLELFYLLKTCIPADHIKSFFAPILTEDYYFALFIMTNYAYVRNAEELARLSNYTFSGFDKQFRKVFGMAPYRWMLQKKINNIYHQIWATSKPIKVIAEECGFANSSQLGDFCRKHIGFSPAIIRKKRAE